MPQNHLILPEFNLVFLRYSGHVTLNDQRQLVADVTANPDHRYDMPKLSDASSVTGSDIDATIFMALRDRLESRYTDLPGPILWAHFAPSDTTYGMARMFESLMSDITALKVEVFRDLPDALDFLGLSDTDVATHLGLADAM